jgi:hypothetical protein
VTRVSSYIHISDKHSHWTYVTHETRAHDKPARRARRSVLGRRRGSGRVTGPARRVSGLSTAPLRSPCGPHSIARRSLTHIARTLTTPREPTATSLSGARREIILRLLVEHDERKQSQQTSRTAHWPFAVYARAINRAAPRASAQRTASLEALKRETRPGRFRPWSAKPGDLVLTAVTLCEL